MMNMDEANSHFAISLLEIELANAATPTIVLDTG